MRCLAQATQLESIQQAWASIERARAKAAMATAEQHLDAVRVSQTGCAVCGQPLAGPRGVLFQGDELVHAACWKPPTAPAAGPEPEIRKGSESKTG